MDLKVLFDTIMDISTLNRVPYHVAFNKFLDDVRNQYDPKLGFEHETRILEAKLGKLTEEVKEKNKRN
jgi:hypothetical protein